jgi:A/G-specific adenine glycosylase
VLARFRAVEGWPGRTAVHKRLWEIADELTPEHRSADFSQAMMDMGATLCTRSAPDCEHCPLRRDCEGLASDNPLAFPGRKPRKTIPVKNTVFLIVADANGDIWLERRPPSGIWGGLWCFPEIEDIDQGQQWCRERWGLEPATVKPEESFRHTFSHYHLEIQPLRITLAETPQMVMEAGDRLWYNRRRSPEIGLAAPVASLLAKLAR